MKTLLLSVLLLISSTSHAYIYCPTKIQCTESGNINSCHAIGSDFQYWDKITQNGSIENATYTFILADGYNTNLGCIYQYQTIKYTKTIGLFSSKKLQAYVDDSNGWFINGNNSRCTPANFDVTQCPFIVIDANLNLNK